jgi:hypothetical protein
MKSIDDDDDDDDDDEDLPESVPARFLTAVPTWRVFTGS